MDSGEQVLDGVWRFTGVHPEWEPNDGWEPEVAWWAVRTTAGLVLIDPLAEDFEQLDEFVRKEGDCTGVVRTTYWHERSVTLAADRYGAPVLARPAPADAPRRRLDQFAQDGEPLADELLAFHVPRDDEIAVWLPGQRALVFGDVMLRDDAGRLTTCPDSWLSRAAGPAPLRAALRELARLPVEHVLVSHGPLVLGDGDRFMDALDAG